MLPAQPFYFGSEVEPIFGWYHTPEIPNGGGVVLCSPLGLDATRSHWSYRHLAERLARAGFGVLRFDWPGTGDSAGDDAQPDRVAVWIAGLNLAIDELKRRSGAPRPALVGLRVGATLAAQVAAEREDIGALVLWMPALTGGGRGREMAKLHKLYLRIVPQADVPEPDGEELLGSFASKATIADLARVDLLALPRRPAPRILVVEDGVLRGAEQLRERLAILGAEVEWRRGSGQKFLFTVPHRATLPDESLNTILHWLETLPVDGAKVAPSSPPATTPFRERPVHCRVDGRLFGIVAPPVEPPPPERPAILLLNAGAVNRTGPHRLYVTMARRWAALGFAVLRIDLSGIGDTPAADGAAESLVYPRDGLTDIDAAREVLARETGASRFIIAGLCSGADFAYQIARRGGPLAGVIMMNPRTFLELDLARVEGPPVKSQESDLASKAEALRVAAGLRQISLNGIDALLVVSRPDPGIDFVDRHAPGPIRESEGLPRFVRVNISGTDHTFTTLSSQRRVLEITTQYLVRHR